MWNKKSSDQSVGGLKLEKINKTLGELTLVADFSVEPAQRAVLVGKSGSGKSTLLRIIAGLESLSTSQSDPGGQGRIWIGDEDITTLAPHKREIGIVFQNQALFPALSVLENVTFGLRMRGISADERESLARPWLSKVGLHQRIHSPVGQLSGGEAQRVALIRALIWKPRVLLLDEPFSALDPELRSFLRAELLEFHRLWPIPWILVSHDSEDLDRMATLRLRLSGDQRVRRIQVE